MIQAATHHHYTAANQTASTSRDIHWRAAVSRPVPPAARGKAAGAVPAIINLNGVHNRVISGKNIAGAPETCITLTNCYNIRITGCRLINGGNRGIYMHNCHHIVIENNLFSNLITGVLADHCGGGIRVDDNQFLNMIGPMPGGQYVQFNTVNGEGLSISRNKGENLPGHGKPEDGINLYKSNGTAISPIKVIGNQIRGGGPSPSGGGIMLGDNGGSYQLAEGNILVNPGEYGMAIAGGDHISLINNTIYGKAQPFTNVGLYVNAIGGYAVSNAVVKGNKINFYNAANYNNNWWLAGGTQKPEGWDNGGNLLGDKSLGEHLLPATLIKAK